MDPGEGFSGGMFRWDPRAAAPAGSVQPYIPSSISHMAAPEATQPALSAGEAARAAVRELEDVFVGYGVRYATVARMGDLGFTASTLAGMREEEVDDMMATLSHLFRWDLLVGERYGIKAAIRAERRRIDSLVFPPPPQPQQQPTGGLHLAHNQHHAETIHFDDPRSTRSRLLLLSPDHHTALDALSQEGLSEEAVQLEREAAGSGGEAGGEYQGRGKNAQQRSKKRGDKKRKKKKKGVMDVEEDEEVRIGEEEEEEDDAAESESERGGAGAGGERQREHPFIVTEPGEVARAKKNGLDYLFHLYQQCHQFLLQVQAVAKDRGDKCPTKVTNLVFRYAKRVGASYINKPKMRHYVHCYALHVLDEEGSNALRRAFKERGENVGAWRLACYKPLVAISAAHDFDVDAVFNAHPRLSIWYVPTKLRQLCHLARAAASSSSNSSPVVTDAADVVHLFAAAPLRRSPHDRSPAFPWAAST